jgi:hypothetical protein
LFLCDDWKWMAFDWAAGVGSRNRAYGENSDQVADIRRNERDFERVDWARKRYQQKNANNKGPCCDFSRLQAVTDVGDKFGVVDFLQSYIYGDCARQYIGSYSVEVTPISCTQARFTITNNSSFESFSYGLGPAWDGGPMGNFRQTYTWDENL